MTRKWVFCIVKDRQTSGLYDWIIPVGQFSKDYYLFIYLFFFTRTLSIFSFQNFYSHKMIGCISKPWVCLWARTSVVGGMYSSAWLSGRNLLSRHTILPYIKLLKHANIIRYALWGFNAGISYWNFSKHEIFNRL